VTLRSSAAPAPRHAVGAQLGGLAVAVAAGYVFSALRTPLPWMLGPLSTIAALRVAGAPVLAPRGARQVGQWVIGTALGLYFTPYVVREVASWWPLLAAGALFAIAVGYGAGIALATLAGVDRTTAVFASVPGGAAEMSVLGERFGARVDRVAAAQSLRIAIVVIVVPAVYALAGVHGADPYVPGTTTFSASGFPALMLATAAGGAIATWIGLPNAFVLGSLAVAIPLTAAEINLSAMPTVATNAAQCLLGCALGARFQPDFLRGAARFVGAVLASVLATIAVSAAFGVLLARLSGLHPATLVLGTAPGGIAEMCVTAKVLQLGVPLVTAFHVSRVAVLLLATAPLFSRVRAWRRERTDQD
jgi:membrane AbrB-like protein